MTHDVRVAIVGAGPQGLTAAVYLVAAGVDPSDIVVIDPSGRWLDAWHRGFAGLEIAHLRSPPVHHPHPHPYGLVDFARAHRRTDELVERYRLPTTGLFADFCRLVVDQAGLAGVVRRGEVVGLRSDGELTLACGAGCRAQHVVWATNPARFSWPESWPRAGRPGLVPWHGVDLSGPAATVAIVGGGLTAAHLVERAVASGRFVEWLTRRPVGEREFDTGPGWLGPKEMRGFSALSDARARLGRVIEARGGGTVPPWMLDRLRRAERTGRLRRRVGAIGLSHSPDGRPVVSVDAAIVTVDEVWLATGDQPCVSAAPPLERLCRSLGVECVGGRPVLDPSLRLPGSVVQVVGRLAQLELGPTAGNLAGARRGAELVVGSVVGLDASYALMDA